MEQEKQYITLTDLRQIFTQKNIDKHFKKADKLAKNPHLSKTYQYNHDLEVRLYLIDRVLQAMTDGVPFRFAKGFQYLDADVRAKFEKATLFLKLDKYLEQKTKIKPNKI